jgi:hypothetical protein
MEHRFQCRLASDGWFRLWDTVEDRPVFSTERKTEVIAEAQRRNGFKPADGKSQTYHNQCRKEVVKKT